MQELKVTSTRRQELIDITREVRDAATGEGALLIYVPHTTAGVLINEHADPDVARDILTALDQVVPSDGIYRHAEGNSPAHVKASMVGSSCLIPVSEGQLALGIWQGIFFAEFDGPRQRTVLVSKLGGE
ncbi:MAG: secondary thiamine-phosphate synthase enzyme YjbQ [Chloroflexota bacterium]